MRITTKGQVTIPQAVREKLGLHPHTEVEFIVERGRAYLRKSRRTDDAAAAMVRRIRERGAGKMTISSKELLAMLRDPPDELDAG